MKVDEARRILSAAEGSEEPADLPLSILPKLTIDDVPNDSSISNWDV